jgi:hypothetical protein
LAPKSSTSPLIPFKVWNATYPTPVIGLVPDTTVKFTQQNLQQIKSTLSQGIAIAVYMNANVSAFNYYNGNGYMTSPCTSFTVDHAVTLVGYGTL